MGYRQGIQAALDDGKILEVVRYSLFFQDGFYDGEEAGDFFQYLYRAGMEIGVRDQFPLEGFRDINPFERDLFSRQGE